MADDPIRTGERVAISCLGASVVGTVAIASANGRSLAVVFDGMLAGHVGGMAILIEDDGQAWSLIGRVKVTVTRVS